MRVWSEEEGARRRTDGLIKFAGLCEHCVNCDGLAGVPAAELAIEHIGVSEHLREQGHPRRVPPVEVLIELLGCAGGGCERWRRDPSGGFDIQGRCFDVRGTGAWYASGEGAGSPL